MMKRIVTCAAALTLAAAWVSADELKIAAKAASSPVAALDQEALRALHEAMLGGMNGMRGLSLTGNPDEDFVTAVLHQHRHTLAIAHTQLKHTKDPQVREQAQSIAATSEKEIAHLQRWQQSRAKQLTK
jgi:uncharacterized protein (DUF305 family)